MAAVIGDQLIPYLAGRGWMTELLAELLPIVETACSRICYYGLPYTFLMFAVVYYPGYSLWTKRRYIPGCFLFRFCSLWLSSRSRTSLFLIVT